MPDWLAAAFPSDAELRWPIILVRLLAALVVGAVVAAIYRATRRRPAAGGDLSQTLLLLAVVIAMITLAIGDNAARAFSLVGALAIVRFRSVVEDPRDTAFVILAVAVGLAVGAGFIWVPVMGLPIAGCVAWAFAGVESRRAAAPRCRVVLRSDGSPPPGAVRGVLERHLEGPRQRRVETVKKGTLVEQVWSGRLRAADGAERLVADLRGLAGVAGVDVVLAE